MYASEVTRRFAAAISAAELDRATSFFAEDGCFVTPDATTVHGRRRIREVLAQLTASRVRLSVAPEGVRVSGDVALCHERWTFTYARNHADPYSQIARSTVLLHRSDRGWQLTIVAPWRAVAPVGIDGGMGPTEFHAWVRRQRENRAKDAERLDAVMEIGHALDLVTNHSGNRDSRSD